MKSPLYFILSLCLLLITASGTGQILKPVSWTFQTADLSKDETILIFKASIDKGWHLYSQNIPDGGPIPTSFIFNTSADYNLIGKVTEGESEEFYDPNFEMKLRYFSNNAVFKQKIKINNKKSFKVTGTLEFMTCDDQRCLPPEQVDFEVTIGAAMASDELSNQNKVVTLPLKDSTEQLLVSMDSAQIHEPTQKISELEPGCGAVGEGEIRVSASLWAIFIGGMIGGLLALLTPCVFPMIPLTVSFFTKRSKTRAKGLANALVYAASIIVIYVGLGFIITVSFGSDALNAMASNVYFNLAFFVIFVIFAISFFGAFEITLPSSFINKADSAADRGGLIGIFFMAFTLSLVSFSCTGPIIGTLLVEAAHGRNYLGPLMGMCGFSLALALPFALFAAFPGWLNSLPKSGGWLNTVKVSLGFIELALAFKFLSNVDLAYHWGILKREIFIALWVIIFGLLGIYLLGKLKFSHDSEVKHVSIMRLIFAIISLTFTLYLIPGIWGAPLKLISGFPPPEFYKEWITSTSECPHDLTCFHDLEEGMAYAKQQDKPAMIDFTGWSCVNCRKMEDKVWSHPKILKKLSEDYVLISLYVDDKKLLPEGEQYISATGKKIKTTGNKWSDVQASRFNTNSQPYYVLLDNNGNLLAEPRGYTPDVDTYAQFLDEGLCRYEKRRTSE